MAFVGPTGSSPLTGIVYHAEDEGKARAADSAAAAAAAAAPASASDAASAGTVVKSAHPRALNSEEWERYIIWQCLQDLRCKPAQRCRNVGEVYSLIIDREKKRCTE